MLWNSMDNITLSCPISYMILDTAFIFVNLSFLFLEGTG